MLQLKSISYTIGDRTILENINLEFSNGLYALVGLNGAGKTTLINIITTLINPTSGSIFYKGKNVTKNTILLRKDLGYMSQNVGLIQEFSVFQNLYYFGLLKGCDSKSIIAKIGLLLKEFQLESIKNKKISNLSGGQRQKVSFVVSIINTPKLLILDEPVNNLDYVERERMYIFLKNLSKDCIIILSTHLVDEISKFCDHKITVSDGNAVICS